MANTIQLRRSAVQGAVPTTTQLSLGEVAINTYDGKMYIKKNDGADTVVAINTTLASGQNIQVTPGSLSTSISISGTIPVSNGGTGASTLSNYYLLRGNGTNAVTSSIIFDNGSAIGIGTSSPTEQLHTTGIVKSDIGLLFGADSNYWYNSGTNVATLRIGTGGNTSFLSFKASSGIPIIDGPGGALGLGISGSELVRIQNGKVGIGILNPDEELSVAGTVQSTTGGFKFPDGSVQISSADPSSGNNGASTSGNITPNGDVDTYDILNLTGAITVLAPSGTPVNGKKLMLRIRDNGTSRGITWTTSSGAYRAIGVTLPTSTTASKLTYIGCIYNATDSFWDIIGVTSQT